MNTLTDGSQDEGCPVTAQGNCKRCGKHIAHSGFCECRTGVTTTGEPPAKEGETIPPAVYERALEEGRKCERELNHHKTAYQDAVDLTEHLRGELTAAKAELAYATHWKEINERVLEDIKVALRMPGTGSYVEYARDIRNEVDDLRARVAQLKAAADEGKKDSLRLDWLERTGQRGHYCGTFNGEPLTRSALDAAMSASPAAGSGKEGK